MARKETPKVNPSHRRLRLKKDDEVKVIAGKDKGKTGRVLDVNRETARVLVEGVNMVKKHMRANPQKGIKGGIAEREAPIHASNVMLVTSAGEPTRVRIRMEKAGDKVRRVRVAAKNGEVIGKG